MDNALDCDILVREFELMLGYYIHFWTNALDKSIKPQNPPGTD